MKWRRKHGNAPNLNRHTQRRMHAEQQHMRQPTQEQIWRNEDRRGSKSYKKMPIGTQTKNEYALHYTMGEKREMNTTKRRHPERLHRRNAGIDEATIAESMTSKPRRPRPTNKEHRKLGRDAEHPRELKQRRRKEEKNKQKSSNNLANRRGNIGETTISQESHH